MEPTAVVNEFYILLDRVEAYLKKPCLIATKFIVEVEGLDGSGKSTLVEKLQQALPNDAIANKTPSASLKDIRPLSLFPVLWDHTGAEFWHGHFSWRTIMSWNMKLPRILNNLAWKIAK